MKYINNFTVLVLCLILSTVGIYLVIYAANFSGAIYQMTHGEIFIIWILMAILIKITLIKK